MKIALAQAISKAENREFNLKNLYSFVRTAHLQGAGAVFFGNDYLRGSAPLKPTSPEMALLERLAISSQILLGLGGKYSESKDPVDAYFLFWPDGRKTLVHRFGEGPSSFAFAGGKWNLGDLAELKKAKKADYSLVLPMKGDEELNEDAFGSFSILESLVVSSIFPELSNSGLALTSSGGKVFCRLPNGKEGLLVKELKK